MAEHTKGPKLSKAQWALLEAGARVESDQKRGALTDGRRWPAINALRRAGLIELDDFYGRGADRIWFRATPAGRTALRRATGGDNG